MIAEPEEEEEVAFDVHQFIRSLRGVKKPFPCPFTACPKNCNPYTSLFGLQYHLNRNCKKINSSPPSLSPALCPALCPAPASPSPPTLFQEERLSISSPPEIPVFDDPIEAMAGKRTLRSRTSSINYNLNNHFDLLLNGSNVFEPHSPSTQSSDETKRYMGLVESPHSQEVALLPHELVETLIDVGDNALAIEWKPGQMETETLPATGRENESKKDFMKKFNLMPSEEVASVREKQETLRELNRIKINKNRIEMGSRKSKRTALKRINNIVNNQQLKGITTDNNRRGRKMGVKRLARDKIITNGSSAQAMLTANQLNSLNNPMYGLMQNQYAEGMKASLIQDRSETRQLKETVNRLEVELAHIKGWIPRMMDSLREEMRLTERISPEHRAAVNALRADGTIVTRRVYEVMMSVDLKHFYDDQITSNVGRKAIELERLFPHIKESTKVLEVCYKGKYIVTCLGLMVGVMGQVISLNSRAENREIISRDHLFLLESERVSLVDMDVKSYKRGYLPLAPYDLVIVYHSSNGDKLVSQLKRGGRIFGHKEKKWFRKEDNGSLVAVPP